MFFSFPPLSLCFSLCYFDSPFWVRVSNKSAKIEKGATGQGEMKRKGKKSNLASKKLKENVQSPSGASLSPGPTKILWSISSEVDDCSKMMDDIKKLLNKIQSLENGKLSSDNNKDVILVHKARIRDIMKGLDSYLASQKLPFADDYCYKCPSKKMTEDSIIILCKGGCERRFHQSCLETSPNLDDERWTCCYVCDFKSRCFTLLQKYHKTEFSTADSWEKVFPEVEEYGLPSDDDHNKTDVEKETYVNPPALVESQNLVVEKGLIDDEELRSKECEKTGSDSSQKNNAGGGSKGTTTKVNSPSASTSEQRTTISTSKVDIPMYSEYVPSAEVRDFEFKGENLGLPIDVRRKYHELCCILKIMPHEKVIEKCNRDLVCAMVVQITEIVEQIKSSCLSTASIDDLQRCKKILSSSAILGMDVDFLLTKIDNLIKHLMGYQANRDKEKKMSSELHALAQLHRQKKGEIIEIESLIYTLGDEYSDILPSDAMLDFEFSKEAKNGLGP